LIAHLFRFYQQLDGVESLMAVLTRCSVFKEQCRSHLILISIRCERFVFVCLSRSLVATRNNIPQGSPIMQPFFYNFFCFYKKALQHKGCKAFKQAIYIVLLLTMLSLVHQEPLPFQ